MSDYFISPLFPMDVKEKYELVFGNETLQDIFDPGKMEWKLRILYTKELRYTHTQTYIYIVA